MIALQIKFNEVDAQSQSLRIFTLISEASKSLKCHWDYYSQNKGFKIFKAEVCCFFPHVKILYFMLRLLHRHLFLCEFYSILLRRKAAVVCA